jgi:hypothetical protein
MNITFKQKHGELLSYYKRPADSPILLRFSSSDFLSTSADDCRSVIENIFGRALCIWSEKIVLKEDIDDIMLKLSVMGCVSSKNDDNHFIYAFFSDWYSLSINVKLLIDLVFMGNVDHWFSGGVGENVILVRRIFELSPEYISRYSVLSNS